MSYKRSKGEGKYDYFYNEICLCIEEYINDISAIGFGTPEINSLSKLESNIDGMLMAVKTIMDSSLELNKLLEHSPDSIYVADGNGETIRVNKAFESTGTVKREEVIGENVIDLEKQGIFKPSVCALVLKEKRNVSVLQEMVGGKETIVSGVPILDKSGKIDRVITNAKLISEFNNINVYIESTKGNNEHIRKTKDSELIAESPKIKEILTTIDNVLDVESTILLMGESGVGKGVFSNYIHSKSNRSKGRLIEINCGAIPETLLESELFGYESGAFTGAGKKGKPGLIELASGGTLLLDEISELPLMLQVKLLHFLQKKKITRVGGTREIYVDARVIAASNKNLKEEVDKGRFRLDLFYRINIIPIEIPPLRKRREDIKPAAKKFFEIFMRKYNKELYISKNFFDELLKYEWPGNMRELENYIERVVVTNRSSKTLCISSDSEEIEKEDEHNIDLDSDKTMPLKKAIEDLEKKLITKAYREYKNSYKVAEKLEISQASAHRKISKYIKD